MSLTYPFPTDGPVWRYNGSLYLPSEGAWSRGHMTPFYIAKSTDSGATWSTPDSGNAPTILNDEGIRNQAAYAYNFSYYRDGNSIYFGYPQQILDAEAELPDITHNLFNVNFWKYDVTTDTYTALRTGNPSPPPSPPGIPIDYQEVLTGGYCPGACNTYRLVVENDVPTIISAPVTRCYDHWTSIWAYRWNGSGWDGHLLESWGGLVGPALQVFRWFPTTYCDYTHSNNSAAVYKDRDGKLHAFIYDMMPVSGSSNWVLTLRHYMLWSDEASPIAFHHTRNTVWTMGDGSGPSTPYLYEFYELGYPIRIGDTLYVPILSTANSTYLGWPGQRLGVVAGTRNEDNTWTFGDIEWLQDTSADSPDQVGAFVVDHDGSPEIYWTTEMLGNATAHRFGRSGGAWVAMDDVAISPEYNHYTPEAQTYCLISARRPIGRWWSE